MKWHLCIPAFRGSPNFFSLFFIDMEGLGNKGGEFLFMFLANNSRFAFTIKNIASWLLNSEAQ